MATLKLLESYNVAAVQIGLEALANIGPEPITRHRIKVMSNFSVFIVYILLNLLRRYRAVFVVII